MTVRVTNRSLVWRRLPFYFHFLFFPSSSIFMLTLQNFKAPLHFVCSFIFGPFVFNCYLFLYKVIYKIELCFQFLPRLIFLFVKFGLHSFNFYYFYLRLFLKLNLFYDFILLWFFFFLSDLVLIILIAVRFSTYYFDCYFFYFDKFFKLIFFLFHFSTLNLWRIKFLNWDQV
jgi:hypothetical protein